MTGLVIGAAVLAAAAAFVAGVALARARGRSALAQAVKAAEERARVRTFIQAQDTTTTSDDRHRLLDVVINLPETVNMMGAARSTSALCRITVRAVMDFVQARRVGLFLAQGAPPRFKLEVFAGEPKPGGEVCFSLGEGRLGQLAELIGVRTAGDARMLDVLPVPADDVFQPDLCVAIRRHGTVHAFLAVDGPKVSDAMTRRILQMLADLHAVSAESLKLLHKERAKAEIDRLTGLFNRHHLDRRLAEEVARAQAYNLRLSVFLFDIDHFKHYNDTNGHQAGDECLRWVAAVTRRVTRGSDVVCRYGGEEFLVILLGAGRDEAWHHSERVRTAIERTGFPGGPTQPLGVVSISGGVASFPEDATDPVTLIGLADRALYAAKVSGRNRVLRPQDVAEVEAGRSEPQARPAARGQAGARGQSSSSERPEPRPRRGADLLRGTDPVMTPIPMDSPSELEPDPTGESAPDRTAGGALLAPPPTRFGSAGARGAAGPGSVRGTAPVLTPLPTLATRIAADGSVQAFHSSVPPSAPSRPERETESAGTYFLREVAGDPRRRR